MCIWEAKNIDDGDVVFVENKLKFMFECWCIHEDRHTSV